MSGKVLERPYPFEGDVESWKKAFEIDVTDLVRAGGQNVLAVRVEDSSGAGGIWRPVWLATSDAEAAAEVNLIPDGGFEGRIDGDGAGEWQKSCTAGEMSFEIVTDRPRTDRACAVIRCIALGSEEDEERLHTGVWDRWHRTAGSVDLGHGRGRADDGDERGQHRGAVARGRDGGDTPDRLHVYLNLMHGTGTAWFDDVEPVAVAEQLGSAAFRPRDVHRGRP